MGGSALEMASGQMRMNERMGSQGLDRAYSVMEQLSAHMTRMISITLIRSTFLLAHETVRKEFQGAEVVFKRAGRWEQIDPSKWTRRKSITIKVAKSPHERTRRAMALKDVLGMQVQMAQAGMDEILVNLDGYHHALIDYCRANDLPNPEKYWIDPFDSESMKARDMKSKSAQAEKQRQDELMRQAVELEQIRGALEKYMHDSQLQFEYWKEALQSEIEEAKIAGQATVQLLQAKETRKLTNGADRSKETDTSEESSR
jgi:hypothetical protein